MNFLITGSSRGIGLELTVFALEAGHKVFAIVRSPEAARSLNTVKSEYKNAQVEQLQILKGDVCNIEDIRAIQKELCDQTVDVLINNAGVMVNNEENFSQVEIEDVRSAFEVNTFAPLVVTQAFLPNLKKSSKAKVVCITSLMGSIEDNDSGGYYGYRMSKAALNMFVKSLSIDEPTITTLALHPGWVRTNMGGPQAPLLPRESARGLFKVITEASRENSGHFYDYTGKPLPW